MKLMILVALEKVSLHVNLFKYKLILGSKYFLGLNIDAILSYRINEELEQAFHVNYMINGDAVSECEIRGFFQP